MTPRARPLLLALGLGVLGSGDAVAAVYRGHTSQGHHSLALTVEGHRVTHLHVTVLDHCGSNAPKPYDIFFRDHNRVTGDGRFVATIDNVLRLRLAGRVTGRRVTGALRVRAPGPRPGAPCDTGRVTFRARR